MPPPSRIRAALERFAESSKLFMLLDDVGRDRLAACGTVEYRASGSTIVRQGEVGDTFYLIAAGEVSVLVSDNKGATPHEVARLGSGQFFGEMAVLGRQPRSATVAAATSCELVRFGREPVMAILVDYPAAREVVGAVGLSRNEANLERASASGDVGLSALLEGDDEDVLAIGGDDAEEEGKP
jgi:CRP-like cAMP-binding protein